MHKLFKINNYHCKKINFYRKNISIFLNSITAGHM